MGIRLHAQDAYHDYSEEGLFKYLQCEMEHIMESVEDFLVDNKFLEEHSRIPGSFNTEYLNSDGNGHIVLETTDVKNLLDAMENLSEKDIEAFNRHMQDKIDESDSPVTYDGDDDTWYEYMSNALRQWMKSAEGIKVFVATAIPNPNEPPVVRVFKYSTPTEKIVSEVYEELGASEKDFGIFISEQFLKMNRLINLDWF